MQDSADLPDDGRETHKTTLKPRAIFVAALVFCLIGGASWLVARQMEQGRDHILGANARLLAMGLGERIDETINANLHALENFADSWQGDAPVDERQYLAHASPLQSRFQALQAINWISPNYIIKYVAPIKGNVPAMGADLKRHPIAGPVLDIAFDQRQTQITPTLELLQGGRGFAAYVPVISAKGEVIGMVNGVFRIRTMLSSVLESDYLAGYTIRVRENDSVLFEMQGDSTDPKLTETTRINVAGRQWQIDVTADPTVAGFSIITPGMISSFGAILAALIAALLFWYANRDIGPTGRNLQRLRGRENISDLALTISRADGHLRLMSPETASFFDLREEDYGFIRLYNIAPEFQSDGTSSHRAQDKLLTAINQGDIEVRREWVVRSSEGVHVVCDLLMTPSETHPDCVDVILHHNPAANAAVNRLRYLATHDPLTGLPNRALFDDRLNQAVAHAKRYEKLLSVLVVDIDNFRAVNDRYGADVGDETLRSISGRLRATVREKDTCARLSGDMFAIIATDLSEAEGAALVAERIVEAISHPIPISGEEIRLHVSVGVALYPNDARAPSQLLANADAAMYRAQKSAESSYCFFVETMNNVMHARLSLETQLRRAVDEKRFILEYQPRFRLSDHGVSGFEALLRWVDDSGQRHLPPDFIAVADRTGLLAPLGRWIIKTACSQIDQWRTEGYVPVPIALNLSGRQFIQADIIKNIVEETERQDIHPALIEIEVAEDIAMRDPERSLTQFYRFSEAGISLTLDQFGAANSSLRYLKRFPIQRIKLSRNLFNIELDEQPENSVLNPAVRLCKSLNRRVVAVGVETEEQLAMLGAADCDELQGFIFSPPVKSEETLQYLTRQITTDTSSPST
ncbi:bifunctional diguanylate cyclase/phosphodiesterase [Thalassospira mesophila]|uniref:Diguanylate cyclase n=1 Tax=Thalassospira mesophila TaxID=1293891 RepID=A0A1Y2L239_9PROT|nr:EAL domain-containing protein [Thalassospira mesophila]OSQ39546.1 diguanylate cyclase [Thalassospira mesophila]